MRGTPNGSPPTGPAITLEPVRFEWGPPHRDLGEDAVIARVGSVIAGAVTEGRHGIGDEARQHARRVALEIATGVLRASRPDVAAHSEDVRIVSGAIGPLARALRAAAR